LGSRKLRHHLAGCFQEALLWRLKVGGVSRPAAPQQLLTLGIDDVNDERTDTVALHGDGRL